MTSLVNATLPFYYYLSRLFPRGLDTRLNYIKQTNTVIFNYKDGSVSRVINAGQTWKSNSLDEKEKCISYQVRKKAIMRT